MLVLNAYTLMYNAHSLNKFGADRFEMKRINTDVDEEWKKKKTKNKIQNKRIKIYERRKKIKTTTKATNECLNLKYSKFVVPLAFRMQLIIKVNDSQKLYECNQ